MATVFWKRFSRLCEKKNVTPHRVMTDTKLNTANPTLWAKTDRIPSMRSLNALAEYFEVSVGYLIGTEYDPPVPDDAAALSDDLLTFALFGRDAPVLSREKLNEIREYARFVKDRE